MASGTCLNLVSQIAGQLIMDQVLKYISDNISQNDWKLKNSALIAFGSILEGPDKSHLQNLVTSAVPTLMKLL